MSDLRELANEHWREAYRRLIVSIGGEWRSYGTVDAFVTAGLPIAFANGCLVLEPTTSDDLLSAADWVLGHGLPFRVRVDTAVADDELLAAPVTLGLEREPWPMPGLVMTPIPAAPPPAGGVSVRRVGVEEHAQFIQVLNESGLPLQTSLRAFAAHMLGEPDLAMFVGYVDGRPVGSSVAVGTPDAGGVYVVGTVESARRRGVGTALTWAAVDQIRAWGHDHAVLQSSPLGFGVYKRMGFQTVVQYAVFTPGDQQPTAARD